MAVRVFAEGLGALKKSSSQKSLSNCDLHFLLTIEKIVTNYDSDCCKNDDNCEDSKSQG